MGQRTSDVEECKQRGMRKKEMVYATASKMRMSENANIGS